MADEDGVSRRDLLLVAAAAGTGVVGGVAVDSATTGPSNVRTENGLVPLRYVPANSVSDLRTALNELGTTPGRVIIGPGTIDDIRNNVEIPANTWLQGSGRSATTLKFADSVSLDLSGLVRITGDNVVVSDIGLNGNRAEVELGDTNYGREYGVYTDGTNNVAIDQVACRDFPGYGIDPHADGSQPTENITITNCLSKNNGLDGITLAGIAGGVVKGNVVAENDRHGFGVTDREATDIVVSGNVSQGNGGSGIVVQNSATNVSITSNTLTANARDGIRIGSGGGPADAVTIANNLIRNNTRYGINVRLSTAVSIATNHFVGNGTDDTVSAQVVLQDNETRYSADVIVMGNQLQGEDNTAHGITERPGNGPSIIGLNIVRGVTETAIVTDHPETAASLNI